MKRATKLTPTGKKRLELEAHLESIGYEKDRFGHWHKERHGTKIRFKLANTSCRFEKQVNINGKNEWVNLRPFKPLYYKNFHLVNGKISFEEGKR